MADVKLSELPAGTPTLSSVSLAVYSPGSSPVLKSVTLDVLRATALTGSVVKIGGITWYFQESSPGVLGVLGDLWSIPSTGFLYICTQNGNHWVKVGSQS